MSATKMRLAERFMAREDRRQWLASASDEELVQMIYDLVREVDEGEYLRDAFYFALGEAFERFAPEADWASDVRDTIEAGVTDLAFELESTIDHKIERAAARMRARFVIPEECVAEAVAS